MTAPLSGPQYEQPVAGMFGGPRGIKRPRGSYMAAGVGDPRMGYQGLGAFWTQYPYMISGTSYYGGMSTTTGATTSTPSEESFAKGDRGADVGPTTDGMSQGGTAAY